MKKSSFLFCILGLPLFADPTLPALPKADPVPTAPALPTPEKPAASGDKADTPPVAPTTAPSPAPEKKPWNANAKVSSHLIAQGDSLSKIAEVAYGRTRYWRILKLYNKVDPSDLKIGQEILAPELPWLVEASGLKAKYPLAADGLLKVYADLKALEQKHPTLGPEQQAEIKPLVLTITDCIKALQAKTEGVKNPPAATLQQLNSCRSSLNALANAKPGKRDHQALAHEHLSNSFVYSVLWALNDFK
jgi:hypothetical protein